MRGDYKRDLNHNYLIFEEEGEVDTASYEVRMILMNSIPGLLPCSIQKIDNRTLFYYEITSRQPLRTMYGDKKLGREELYPILKSLVNTIKVMQAYLLDPGHLVLEPEHIYMEAGGQRAYFSFIPVHQGDAREGMRELMEYLLPKIDHQDPDAVRIGYGIYHCVTEDNFQLEQIERELFASEGEQMEEPSGEAETGGGAEEEVHEREEILRQICREPQEEEFPGSREEIKTAAVVAGGILMIGGGFLAWNYRYIPWNYLAAGFGGLLALAGIAGLIWYRRRKKELLSPGEGTKEKAGGSPEHPIPYPDAETGSETGKTGREAWESSGEETSLLTGQEEGRNHCLRGKGSSVGKLITLEEGVILVGKMAEAVDYCIPLATVSRIHCKLEVTRDLCLIQDLNSKNGTYVNGRLLESREKYPLQEHDEVKIADVIFYYE